MKYIIVEDHGLENAIVFSEILKHSDVANMLPVVSAGFCSFSVDDDRQLKVTCWGDSVSLKKKSRGQIDNDLVLQSLQFRI